LCQQQKKKRLEQEKKTKVKGERVTNNVLMVSNLPSNITNYEAFVEKLFGQFKGYSEKKVISQKAIAFIEFENDSDASLALKALNGFKYAADQALKVVYAKSN